jgi:hypothetical protein
MAWENIFFKNKKSLAKFLCKFFVSEVFHKNVIFNDNVSVIHVLIKLSSGLQRKHPLPRPPPTQCCSGGGEVLALFSQKQCRNRIKIVNL